MCLISEKEATQNLCIAQPYILEDQLSGHLQLSPNYCTGNRCKLGWRWAEHEVCPDCKGTCCTESEPPFDGHIVGCYKCDGTGEVPSDKGYCGLAGKPE